MEKMEGLTRRGEGSEHEQFEGFEHNSMDDWKSYKEYFLNLAFNVHLTEVDYFTKTSMQSMRIPIMSYSSWSPRDSQSIIGYYCFLWLHLRG